MCQFLDLLVYVYQVTDVLVYGYVSEWMCWFMDVLVDKCVSLLMFKFIDVSVYGCVCL